MSNTYNAIFNGKRCLLEVESDGSCEDCALKIYVVMIFLHIK